MAIQLSMVQAISKRPATAAELVAEMHQQYQIAGHTTVKKSKDETDDYSKIVLAEVDKFNGNCNHCGKKGRKEIDC